VDRTRQWNQFFLLNMKQQRSKCISTWRIKPMWKTNYAVTMSSNSGTCPYIFHIPKNLGHVNLFFRTNKELTLNIVASPISCFKSLKRSIYLNPFSLRVRSPNTCKYHPLNHHVFILAKDSLLPLLLMYFVCTDERE